MTSAEPRPKIVPCVHDIYRQNMAVMFVDLDHFMRICTDVAPETVFVLLGEFQRIVTDDVSNFKGKLNAYQGDGVLATFDNAAGQTDCATRALRCAWRILEQINALNLNEAALGGDWLVSASIGLQYGQVWSGVINSSRRYGPTLVGDAVNVAARLEQHAHALDTKIVAGDDLMQRARSEHAFGAFEVARFVNAGTLLIRGRHAPIGVWAMRTDAAEFALKRPSTPACINTALSWGNYPTSN